MNRLRKQHLPFLTLLLIILLLSAQPAMAEENHKKQAGIGQIGAGNIERVPFMGGDHPEIEVKDRTNPYGGSRITLKEEDPTNPKREAKDLLSLEEALGRVDQESPSLHILRYTWEMHRAEIAAIEDQISSLRNIAPPNPAKLPTDPELFYGQVPNYNELSQEEKTKVDQTILNQIMINQSLNSLIEAQAEAQYLAQKENNDRQIEQLKRQIESLEGERSLTGLREEEMRQGLRLMVLTHFAELLSLEKELSLNDAELLQLKEDLKRAEAYLAVRLLSEDARNQTKEALEAKEREGEKLETVYREKKALFLLELGLPMDRDVSLEPIEIGDIERPSGVTEVDRLVERLFPVRKAEEALLFAKNATPLKDETENQKRLREIQEKRAEADLLRTKREMKGKIKALYAAWEKAYLDVLDRREELKRAIKELDKVRRSLSLGIATPYDVMKANSGVKTKEIALYVQELAYKLAKERLQYAEKGYIE